MDEVRPFSDNTYKGVARQVIAFLEMLAESRKDMDEAGHWQISYRIKKPHKIQQKLLRKKGENPSYNITNMNDLVGVRVIVESNRISDSLANFIVSESNFKILEDERFIDRPHADGYRGIHLIVGVQSMHKGRDLVPLELQIRTILQHRWSDLSSREFYATVEDIPERLLESMRSLSEILNCAELEAEVLQRNRILDQCRIVVMRTLRESVLEYFSQSSNSHIPDGSSIGKAGIVLIEIDKQLRQVFGGSRQSQQFAYKTITSLISELIGLIPDKKKDFEQILIRVRHFMRPIPVIH